MERPMFYREIDSRLYTQSTYYLSRCLAQLPWIILQSSLFSFIYVLAFFSVLSPKIYFSFLLGIIASISTATTLSQCFAICTPTEGVANVAYVTFITLCRMMAGFLTTLTVMGEKIPFTKWLNAFDFFKYAWFFLGKVINTDIEITVKEITVKEGQIHRHQNMKEFMDKFTDKETFPSGATDPWSELLCLFVFYLIIHVIAVFVLTFKRWDSR
jgi:hypothetical protein